MCQNNQQDVRKERMARRGTNESMSPESYPPASTGRVGGSRQRDCLFSRGSLRKSLTDIVLSVLAMSKYCKVPAWFSICWCLHELACMIDRIVRHPALPFNPDSLCLRAASRACTNESAMKLIVIGIALGGTALRKHHWNFTYSSRGKHRAG